jgi:hypothetical protein
MRKVENNNKKFLVDYFFKLAENIKFVKFKIGDIK